jgi:beta-phosphoglucomutase
MIKAILFDLDNTLVDTADLHFITLNKSLIRHGYNEIEYKDHLSKFNGLPTKIKLQKLDIPERDIDKIYNLKQSLTTMSISSYVKPCQEKIDMILSLKNNYILGVVTNSIKQTAILMLKASGLYSYFDIITSNEDVQMSKPDKEPYCYTMKQIKCGPKEVLIVEDNLNGIISAVASGAYLIKVKNPNECTYKNIVEFIQKTE